MQASDNDASSHQSQRFPIISCIEEHQSLCEIMSGFYQSYSDVARHRAGRQTRDDCDPAADASIVVWPDVAAYDVSRARFYVSRPGDA